MVAVAVGTNVSIGDICVAVSAGGGLGVMTDSFNDGLFVCKMHPLSSDPKSRNEKTPLFTLMALFGFQYRQVV